MVTSLDIFLHQIEQTCTTQMAHPSLYQATPTARIILVGHPDLLDRVGIYSQCMHSQFQCLTTLVIRPKSTAS